MNAFLSALEQEAGLIAAVACALCVCLLIWAALLTRRVRAVTPHMRHLVRDMQGMSAAEMFEAHLANAEMATRRAAEATGLAEELSRRQRTSLRKVALVKYNADESIGGNMSFSTALLDETDSGFVLTSIYSLEECRVYAKQVVGGEPEQQLSQEERQVLEQALGVGRGAQGA